MEGTTEAVRPAPTLRTVALEDAAHQAAVQPWVTMECHQIDAGRFAGRLKALDLGEGIRVIDEVQSTSINKLGATGRSFCTVSVACFDDPASGRFGHFLGDAAASLFFLPGGTEYDARVPGGVRTLYVSLDQDRILDRLRVLAPDVWERPPHDLVALGGTRPEAFVEVASAAMVLYGRAGEETALDHGGVRDALVESMLLALKDGPGDRREVPGYDARRRRLRHLRQARAYIADCLDSETVPSIVDVCAAVGVSERTLQYAFRDGLGLSPVAYLRVLRLNQVRAMLRDPDRPPGTVTEAAMRWGFFHLGRFAGDYRRLFGETPAETRAATASGAR